MADLSDPNAKNYPTGGMMDNESAPQPQQSGPDWNSLYRSALQPGPSLSDVNPGKDDLGYRSFLRGMGMSQSQINANVARQNAGLEAQLMAQRPAWQDALTRGVHNIGGNAESNGVYNSGQRLTQQNEFQTDQARAQANFEGGIRGQQADLRVTADSQLLDLARQNAEQELIARQRLAQQQVTNQQNPVFLEFLKSQLGITG